jgi:hypothetical protein
MNHHKHLNFLKNIIINVRNFIFLIVILNLLIIFVYQSYYFFSKYRESQDWRLSLPVYNNYDWASEYYKDNKNLTLDFAPFIGFKTKAMSSRTINVNTKGIRRSRNDSDSAQVIFLGASTMFGFGSNDFNTIPSLFSKFSGDSIMVRNLGTNGFTVFQNFIKLTQYLFDQKKPKTVISFDGGVESIVLQNNQQYEMSHLNAEIFQEAVSKSRELKFVEYLKCLIAPLERGANGIRKKLLNENIAIEYENPQELEKALNQYSLNMVNSWEQMLVLCNSKGIDFYCVFSPIFTENSMDISNPLIASNIQKFPQHRIRVRKMLHRKVIDLLQTDRYASLSKRFLDLSIFLDSKQNVYIDPIGHFSPLGNELVANELINHIYK